MVVLTIILIAIIVLLVVFIFVKPDLSGLLFGNSITQKVERKKRIEGEIEVLKKEQSNKVEELKKEYAVKTKDTLDSITAQISSYKAQIKSLEQSRKNAAELLEQESKIQIDRIINTYNSKITSKQNQVKKLGYYVNAEQQNIDDVIDPPRPNAPSEKTPKRKLLLEQTNNKENHTLPKQIKRK